MPALADEIGDDPVFFSLLDSSELRARVRRGEAAPNENREHRVITEPRSVSPFAVSAVAAPAPRSANSQADASRRTPFTRRMPRRQLRTEQAGIGRLVGDAANGGESEVDRGRSVVSLFEMNSVA